MYSTSLGFGVAENNDLAVNRPSAKRFKYPLSVLDRDLLLHLKTHCLATGIQVEAGALDVLSHHGELPLTVHEYATTGGVTLKIGDVFVNAPFDDWFSDRSEATLAHDDNGFVVRFRNHEIATEVLPLPGYLDAVNDRGEAVTATTMSHCDRIRVSPITGCYLDCGFCDFPALRYTRHDAAEVLASLEVAKADRNLPAHHVLISGGSPGPKHYEWFDDTLVKIIEGAGLPVDVMMSPRDGSLDHVHRLIAAGAGGFSFNLEVFGADAASTIMPRKHLRSTPHLARTVEAAVSGVGSQGRVRSLVIVGLDQWQDTLDAITFLCSLGCEPVLSPFRPARDTRLERWEPPTEKFLLDIHEAAIEIAATQGLLIGPRCIPCQHNTLVIPDGTPNYWYSADHAADAPVAAR